MLHGRSVPALPGFDLPPVPGGSPTRYSWAQELAGTCSSSPTPLPASCPPPYPHQLGNSESEEAEVGAVVKYIRGLPGRDRPVRLVGWSAGALVMGPHTLKHPDDVESLFLLAPVFPPKGRWSEKPDHPFGHPPGAQTLPVSTPASMFGFPMHVAGKTEVKASLSSTPALWEPGIEDRVWDACTDNDPVGSKWGPEETPGEY